MNTTQVCVAGIVAVVALGVVADIKARFKKKPVPQPKPNLTDAQVHELVMGRIRKTHAPEMHEAFDIIGKVCGNSIYR
ncbi:hypothetical protein pEaSNUABM37_00062 [Erwinia phage pEa_SNUABM_37]|nr:hypothetical protein pEaSNUABM37_00062 [Erwinia phage pEa_SNUABM_37]QXO10532.1 hypothetical protein pEaSNUABM48_00062 [Erwinia phage pEa_SNUABM_48]